MRSRSPTNPPKNPKILVWDLPIRAFHWSLALCFFGAYWVAESERWRNVHVALGYATVALLAFRLLWGAFGTRFARFGSFRYSPKSAWGYLQNLAAGRAEHYTGHNPAGSWAVYGLLALGLAAGISGWMRFEDIGGDRLESLHEIFANAWLALVALHVVAVIISSILHRENLVRAMLSGYKRGRPGEIASRAAPLVGVVVLLAVFAIIGGYLLLGGKRGAIEWQGAGAAERSEEPAKSRIEN